VDVEEAFPKIAEMTWCHQSQISEWLPWIGRHDMEAPASLGEWERILRRRFDRKNRELDIAGPDAMEVFRVTAWGVVPEVGPLINDLPNILPRAPHLEALSSRLTLWGQG